MTRQATPDASPLAIARALIRCPSVTPQDAGALGILEQLLEHAGFHVERVTFSAPGTPDIDNLYARLGTQRPCLAFAGHTDVVPTGDVARWSHDPFAGEIADGELYGRGAVDMKGGIAAFLAATLAYLAENPAPRGSLAFLITGDEEGPAVNGTIRLLDWLKARGETIDHCVLGEPTSKAALGDTVKIGRRGSLTGHVALTGVQGHVAYPERARNPARELPAVLAALHAPLDTGTAHFDASNLEVTTIDTGNPATNVTPGAIRLTFNIRFNDIWTAQSLAAEVERRLMAASAHASVRFEPSNSPAFLTQPGAFVTLVTDAIERATGHRPALSTTGGTSDARFIKDHCPVVEFGLVGTSMHQIDERVPVADLDALADAYRAILEAYFSGYSTAMK